jgi:hypothetical protein
MSRPTPKPSKKKSDAFAEVAKRLECDEDKGRFEAKLGKLAKSKPQPPKS